MLQIIKKKLRKLGFDIVRMNSDKFSNRDLYEHDIRVIVKQNNPVVFDIGANKGQSILTYKGLFKEAEIFSFEPNPLLFSGLKNQFSSDSKVHLYQDALGEQKGNNEFIIYENNELSSFKSIEVNSVNPFSNEQINSKIIVKTNTLDEFVLEHGVKKIDILKIDTQGYELEILKGATNCLKNGIIENIYLELNFIEMYKNQSNYLDILQLLNGFDYMLVGLYELNRPEYYISWSNALFRKKI